MIKKKNITQEDINTWKDYIKDPKDIIDKEASCKSNKSNYLRYKYDLHGFTLDHANKTIEKFIGDCYQNGVYKIIVVTGKGLHSNHDDVYKSSDFSKLRFSVPEFVNSDPEISKMILSIGNPSQREGGEGVLLIKLKKL